MLARERQNIILELIKKNGSIKMADIMNDFKVSHETARRDLDALQDKNLLKRVYGGAILPDDPDEIHTNATRSGVKERKAIAKAAAELIRDGNTIFLSVGLTTHEISKELKNRKDITVVTNSILVLNELLNTNVHLYILGGHVSNYEDSIEGNIAVDTLSNFYVDIAFIGAGGITKDIGISDYSPEVANLNRSITRRAKKNVLVAHSKKFGTNCLSMTCPVDDMNTIITDSRLPVSDCEYIREKNIKLIQVEV